MVLTSHCVSPNAPLLIQYVLYIISLKTLDLPSEESALTSETLRVQSGEDGLGMRKSGPIACRGSIRAFGITGEWKATALKAGVWVDAVTEGGRRFMIAWRKEEAGAARHRQEKSEATRLGKLLSHTEAQNFAR